MVDSVTMFQEVTETTAYAQLVLQDRDVKMVKDTIMIVTISVLYRY